jgi:hypothetical protein
LEFEISDFRLPFGAAKLVEPFQEFFPLSPRIGGAARLFIEISLAGDIGVLERVRPAAQLSRHTLGAGYQI